MIHFIILFFYFVRGSFRRQKVQLPFCAEIPDSTLRPWRSHEQNVCTTPSSPHASRSHFAGKKHRKKTNKKTTQKEAARWNWKQGTAGTASSVVGTSVQTLLFLNCAVTSSDCRSVYRFLRAKFCDNFLCPSNPHCRFFRLFVSLISMPFFAVTLHRLLCM